MKKFAFTLTMIFVISSLSIISSISFGVAQTPTNVTGIIFSDSTWTTAHSPYNITRPVAIAKGATLTIQPGVTVNLNTFTLQVNGTLTARGTSTNPITINGGYQPRLPIFGSEDRSGEIDFTSEDRSGEIDFTSEGSS